MFPWYGFSGLDHSQYPLFGEKMPILVIQEIFRRIDAEMKRVQNEQEKLSWYHVRARYNLWLRMQDLKKKRSALQLEQRLLLVSNSFDPCAFVLQELYRPRSHSHEYHIGLWTGEPQG